MNISATNSNQMPLMNFWGLSLLLLLILVFQFVGYGISVYSLSFFLGIETSEIKYLMSHPDGTAISINISRFSNLIQFINYMGVPALLLTLVNRTSWTHVGGYSQKPSVIKIIAAIFFALGSVPVIAVLNKLTASLPYPDSLASIGQKLTDARIILFENMLDIQRIDELLFCILLLAFLPAFLEEYIFRGLILKIGLTHYKKPITSILFQAAIFSLLHFSLFEFWGIFLIGAMFGYIAFKNESIWLSSIAHFVFNTTSILIHYYLSNVFNNTGIAYNEETILVNFSLALPASIIMALTMYILVTNKRVKE